MTEQDHEQVQDQNQKSKRTPKQNKTGIIRQKENGLVTLRVLSCTGIFSARQLCTLATVAETFGNGTLVMTARMNAEVPGITLHDTDDAIQALSAGGCTIGSTGTNVRSVTACKGTTCRFGLFDTQALGSSLQELYGSMPMPKKVKIGVTGCPNNCMRVDEQDIGLMGVVRISFSPDICTSCLACTRICRESALTETATGVSFQESACIRCGACLPLCKESALVAEEKGLLLFVGGQGGRHPISSHRFPEIIPEHLSSEVVAVILRYYQETGSVGERLGVLLNRVGAGALWKQIKDVLQ